jgi:N-acetylmuramoyl-L-alanine amidase
MMVLQEANGEPIRGMVAVAAVALDRVHDPRWPDTLEGVLYQRKQFSGLHHNYRRKDYSDAEIAQARKAVIRATMGERPCGFEVFWYHADWINVPMWARDQMQMTPACHVGDHLFYRHVRGDEDD